MDSLQRRVFFDVHRDLPREGPGNRASTNAALARILSARDADAPASVLDVGCGPGMQTLDLAERLPGARILAVDLHEPFLRELARRIRGNALAERVLPLRADMARLPLKNAGFDLVWCEGAAYLVGVSNALAGWHRLLRPGGACAFTEAVWLRPDPPQTLRDFWAAYPDMADREACRVLIRRAGFELLDDFVLPSSAWWDDYYDPMTRRLDELEGRYDGDSAALAVLAGCRAEIETYRRYQGWYGYAFFVARKPRGA